MSQVTEETAVRFRNVTRKFGEVLAVDDVTFDIRSGELVTLLGPSGCGKTTTLRLVAGLELASSGRIEIVGRDVTGLSASQRDVAMVFQSYALFPHMTVQENVAYGLKMSGNAKADIVKRVDAVLDTVGLSGLGARMPAELSGGQQQRVAVARAVVLEPDVLLFDEPLSNLDAKLRRHVRDEIRELQLRLGLTAIYVTHDQEEALAISDRIFLMHNGVVVQSGTPSELYDRPSTRFVADFIGDANVIEADVLDVSEGRAKVRVGGLEMTVPACDSKPGPVLLAVRPQSIVLCEDAQPDCLPVKIARTAYLGTRNEVELETQVGMLRAATGGNDRRWKPGMRTGIRFVLQEVVLLDA